MHPIVKSRLTRARVRLRVIPTEIGKAHLAGNAGLRMRLLVEKALHLEILASPGGTGEILALAQKEAAEALDTMGMKREALQFYRKAFENRGRLIKHLVGTVATLEGQKDEIARLNGILASNPDKETRARIEEELRCMNVLLPGEALRYEVNVEEVKKLIARLEQQKRGTETEEDFTQRQLRKVKTDLEVFQVKIRSLEAGLGNKG